MVSVGVVPSGWVGCRWRPKTWVRRSERTSGPEPVARGATRSGQAERGSVLMAPDSNPGQGRTLTVRLLRVGALTRVEGAAGSRGRRPGGGGVAVGCWDEAWPWRPLCRASYLMLEDLADVPEHQPDRDRG